MPRSALFLFLVLSLVSPLAEAKPPARSHVPKEVGRIRIPGDHADAAGAFTFVPITDPAQIELRSDSHGFFTRLRWDAQRYGVTLSVGEVGGYPAMQIVAEEFNVR